MTDLHWTEVDQVTTVWTDTPGPLTAGLLFRTGLADETLATAGLTHLLEHLSISAVKDQSPRHNGLVTGAMTGFYTMGQPKEVSNFFAEICQALNSLPGDRLDSEKQVLAAENASRSYDFFSNLLMWRYGAAGYGLLGMPEYGLRKITLEQLQDYATQRFTRQNAVLWLSGPVPDDLRLTLPYGIKHPIPSLTPIQETFPSWFIDNLCGGVAVGVTVPRIPAATIFCEIATRRLHKRLRTDQAVSYAPTVSYVPLNADIAHLVLHADSDQNRRVELANAFGEVFQQLNVLDDDEIESARNQILEYRIGSLAPPPPDRNIMEVQQAAMDWIMGDDFEPIESVVRHLNSVTVEEVSSFARDIRVNAMFALPEGARLFPVYGKMATASKAHVVRGQRAKNMDTPIRREELVYGPDGVSLIWPDHTNITVRFSELAAALCYEDGGVHLIGSDAVEITVEPALWRNGPSICREILEQVPVHLLIDQGSRPANTIPKPTSTAWQRFRARLYHVQRSIKGRPLFLFGYIFLFIVTVLIMFWFVWVMISFGS